MDDAFQNIVLRVPPKRFAGWDEFTRETPEYSIGLEVVDDVPGHQGHHIHFDHHAGVIREATMSAAMQAYIAVRQGRLMEKWLRRRRPVPVYVWNADQDVCLAAFVLEYHQLLERAEGAPLLRWIVQYNNKIDVCGGLYPVKLEELEKNHFTWVFEPYRQQRVAGKAQGDEALVIGTIRQVCDRLLLLLQGKAGVAPITAQPEILYDSPYDFVIVDEKGDPRLALRRGRLPGAETDRSFPGGRGSAESLGRIESRRRFGQRTRQQLALDPVAGHRRAHRARGLAQGEHRRGTAGFPSRACPGREPASAVGSGCRRR